MRYLRMFCLILFAAASTVSAQTAEQVLQRALDYHDPDGQWFSSRQLLQFAETRPGHSEARRTLFTFDSQADFSDVRRQRDGHTIRFALAGSDTLIALDDKIAFTSEMKQKFRLEPGRAAVINHYYAYLWGLPMKLRDPGTIIDPEVKREKFDGKEALALRVTYTPEVGKDIWYFYFDPQSGAMTGYRFYHNEAKNDGEYIYLDAEIQAGNMRLPKRRRWYTHAEDKHLGTDTLTGWQVQPSGTK